jgi:hypothetical protein
MPITHQRYEPQFIVADDYHPEFGYLCPSPRMRKTLRMSAIAALMGLAVGAVTMLALDHRRSADQEPGAPTLATAITATTEPTDARPTPASPTPNTAVADGSSASRLAASCSDLAGSFLDAKCQGKKQRKTHAARSHSLANLLLGHGSDTLRKPRPIAKIAAGETVPAAPNAEASRPTIKPGVAKNAQASAAASTRSAATPSTASPTPAASADAPVQASAARAKKPVKTAKRHRHEDVAIDSYAALPPPPIRDPFGLFRPMPRFGSATVGGLY